MTGGVREDRRPRIVLELRVFPGSSGAVPGFDVSFDCRAGGCMPSSARTDPGSRPSSGSRAGSWTRPGHGRIGGKPLRRDSPALARKFGLAMAYQDTSPGLAQPVRATCTWRRRRVVVHPGETVGAAPARVRLDRSCSRRPAGTPRSRAPALRGREALVGPGVLLLDGRPRRSIPTVERCMDGRRMPAPRRRRRLREPPPPGSSGSSTGSPSCAWPHQGRSPQPEPARRSWST
jgi:hypothetical protein